MLCESVGMNMEGSVVGSLKGGTSVCMLLDEC